MATQMTGLMPWFWDSVWVCWASATGEGLGVWAVSTLAAGARVGAGLALGCAEAEGVAEGAAVAAGFLPDSQFFTLPITEVTGAWVAVGCWLPELLSELPDPPWGAWVGVVTSTEPLPLLGVAAGV